MCESGFGSEVNDSNVRIQSNFFLSLDKDLLIFLFVQEYHDADVHNFMQLFFLLDDALSFVNVQ